MRVALSVAVFLVAAAVAAQFGETIEVRLHQLEVIVETKAGVPVTNLTKDDFVVRQDGVVQDITNFSINVEEQEIDDFAATVRSPAEGIQPSAADAPQIRKREVRRYVFFLDQAPLHELARVDFLKQTSALLDGMAPGDQAMVVVYGAGKQIQLYFTPDANRVQETISTALLHMMRLEDMQVADMSATPIPMRVDPGEPVNKEDNYLRRGDCGSGMSACIKNRLNALRVLVRWLAGVEGRKAVLLMTNRISSLGEDRDLKPFVDEVARAASESSVMIYALEPFEPGYDALPGVTASASGRESVSKQSVLYSMKTTRGVNGVFDALQELTRATGGRSFDSSLAIDDMFQQVRRDQAFYYSLAFVDRKNSKGGLRVSVSVRNRPDLVVRSRRHVRNKTQHDVARDQAVGALLESEPANRLGVDVSLGAQKTARRQVEVPLTIRVPIGRLTMLRRGGEYRGSFMVYVAAQSVDKLDLGEANQEQTQEVVIPLRDWADAQQEFFTFETAVRMRPGRYRLAVGVVDGAGGDRGFEAFDVVAGAGGT